MARGFRLPSVFRNTAFRLTLLFLALFAASASAFLGYIYGVTAGEVSRRADGEISREIQSLLGTYRQAGMDGLNLALIERTGDGRAFVYLLSDKTGKRMTGTLAVSPVDLTAGPKAGDQVSATFQLTQTDPDGALIKSAARGQQVRLDNGATLFVGLDIGEGQSFVLRIVRAIWGAGALVLLLGLAGGLVVSRNVSRAMARLNQVVTEVQGGNLGVRIPLRGVRDEFDELAAGMNDMLDRLERSIVGLRHVGDSIAHDLRSPLTRLRTRLELALIDVENGKGDAQAALARALEDADRVLSTFNTVLAIARLQSAGEAPDQSLFDAGELTAKIAELYAPLCEDRGIDFQFEATPYLRVKGNQEFISQALANLLDNAVKYTPSLGAIMLRLRRRASGEVEFSITDTGPGVPPQDRERVVQRFVRLENSRNLPGAGLGLALVAAVAQAHDGRLDLDEGPGEINGQGPGLRVAFVLPRVV